MTHSASLSARATPAEPASPARPADPLLFDPVPLERVTARGWSTPVQRAFIAALARHGTVATAARSVGRSARSAYLLRRREGGAGFAAAWDMAQRLAVQDAHAAILANAFAPCPSPVVRRGRIIGEVVRFDPRPALAAIRARIGVEQRRREARFLDEIVALIDNIVAETPRNPRT